MGVEVVKYTVNNGHFHNGAFKEHLTDISELG
jgi:hypothetical protein